MLQLFSPNDDEAESDDEAAPDADAGSTPEVCVDCVLFETHRVNLSLASEYGV